MPTLTASRTLTGLIAVCLFITTACGDDDASTATNTVPDPTEAAAELEPTAAPAEPTAPLPDPTPTPPPTATEAPSPTPPLEDPVAWTNGSVGPGYFRTEGFEYPFAFKVGEGWTPAFAGAPDNANIQLPGQAIIFVLWTTAPDVASLEAELSGTDGVELADKNEVDVGGIPGMQFVIDGQYTGVRIGTRVGEFTLDGPDDEAARLTVLEHNEDVLVILEVVPPDAAVEGWAETATVIDTIEWD